MKVDRISLITPSKTTKHSQFNNNKNSNIKNMAYNPIAYQDYNVNFTARLFRTPENFYAQEFNMKGMPDAMRTYLLDDFEDRKKMPPAQMLNETYADIEVTENLDQVKKIFSDEPLFKNLTDVPNRKARAGVLAEIDIMKEDGRSLFKNGKDNLGHYLLKKIYLEGKTLKEINVDFKKDISFYYKDLSPIEYDTLSAFGIKYPNNSFWKSLTATREEFPYTYKPRKANTRSIVAQQTEVKKTANSPVEYRPKNKFEGLKDWEINKITDAFLKSSGNSEETVKRLKKTGVKDDASLNFVAKYMSEINSVVLERLHISPDMKDFFENYDGLSKSQKQKFAEYMRLPEVNEWRSKVMQSTIKYFFEAYGADGNNEEFKELLDYAHSIKPNRLQKEAEHAARQAYYEEVFAQHVDEQLVRQDIDAAINKLQELQKTFETNLKELKGTEVNSHVFNTNEGEVVIKGNLKDLLAEDWRAENSFMPKRFSDKFIRFLMKQPEVDDKFILTKQLLNRGVEVPKDERLISEEQFKQISIDASEKFKFSYAKECQAARQSIIDGLSIISSGDDINRAYGLTTTELNKFLNQMPSIFKDLYKLKASKIVEEKYSEYLKPLSNSDANKISLNIINLMKDYKEPIPGNAPDGFEELQHLLYSITLPVKNKSTSVAMLRDHIRKDVNGFGGTAKVFIGKDVPKAEKLVKLAHFLIYEVENASSFIMQYCSVNPECLKYLKEHAPEIHNVIQRDVIPFIFKGAVK